MSIFGYILYMKKFNIPNPGYTAFPYWNDGNKNLVEWFKKGWWKRYFRKKVAKG